jgi:hypothetical protein
MKVGWKGRGMGKMNVFSRDVLNALVFTRHKRILLDHIIDLPRLAKSTLPSPESTCHHHPVLGRIVKLSS